ncbi:MAG: hypothetical protein ACKPEA_16970, partial [Planctomycetota bacterium]
MLGKPVFCARGHGLDGGTLLVGQGWHRQRTDRRIRPLGVDLGALDRPHEAASREPAQRFLGRH